MAPDIIKLEVGDWKLEKGHCSEESFGNWSLEDGKWTFEARNCTLEARKW